MYLAETKRLRLIPMTIPLIEAGMKGEKKLATTLQAEVPLGLIEQIHTERVFPIRYEKIKKKPELANWYGFVLEKERQIVIGMMGFKDLPDKYGSVEIGYGIHSHFQGKGYATEMVDGMIAWAFHQEEVKKITASNVLKENKPSIKILQKMGMELIREHDEFLDFVLLKEDWKK